VVADVAWALAFGELSNGGIDVIAASAALARMSVRRATGRVNQRPSAW